MRNTFLGLLVFGMGFFLQAGAMLVIPAQYETYDAFAQSESAKTCSVVTDGCNRWNYQDGEMGDPIVACRLTEDFQYSWSCSEEVEGGPLYENKDFEVAVLHVTAATNASAEYNSKESFERSEGQICKNATDGVNTFMMQDGKVFAGTKIGYPEDFTPTLKCTNYRYDIISSWSQSEKNEYNTLIDRASVSEMDKVETTVDAIDAFLQELPAPRRELFLDRVINRIDVLLFEIVMAYPQDIALPDTVYPIYDMLRYLKFELTVQK